VVNGKYVNDERVSTYSSGGRWTIIAIVVSCSLPLFVHHTRLVILAILIFLYRGRGHLTRSFRVAIACTGRLPPFTHVIPVLVRAGPRSKVAGAPFKGGTGLGLAGSMGERGGRRAFMTRRDCVVRRWGVVEGLMNGRRRNGGRSGMIIENPAE
jgi:hypothetical protein